MNKYKKQFGIRLRAYRIWNGFTLRSMCKLIKYDPSNYSKVERGLMPPPIIPPKSAIT